MICSPTKAVTIKLKYILMCGGVALALSSPLSAAPQELLYPSMPASDEIDHGDGAIVPEHPGDYSGEQTAPLAAPVVVPEPDRSQPPKSVDVGTLGSMRIGGLGLKTPEQTNLPATVWQGSTADTATMRLLAIPSLAPSGALIELERRLLVTGTTPPETASDDADLAFMSARLQRLAAMGDLDALSSFFDRIGREYQHVELNQLAADVRLLTGNTAEACSIASDMPVSGIMVDHLRLTAFCRAFAGDVGGAALVLEMLAEQKAPGPAFTQLMNAYLKQVRAGTGPDSKTAPKLKSMKGATPLVLALARETGAPLAADVTSGASFLVLAALADDKSLDHKIRVQAADAVANRGGYAVEKLMALYSELEVKPADLANAVTRVKKEPAKSPYASALLYQAARAADTPDARIAILREGFKRARSEGTRMLYATVMAPVAEQIPPAGEYLADAEDIIRILLLSGRISVAEEWYATLRRQAAVGDAAAEREATAVWPLMMMWAQYPGLNGAISYSPEFLDAWVATRSSLPASLRDRQISLVAKLLSWGGLELPPGMVPETGDARGNTGFDLAIVASEGRLGEMILEASKLAGEGLSKLDRDAIITLGTVFRSQGFEREARQIVTEALIIQGL